MSLKAALIDVTFNAWWTKFGSKPETIQQALDKTRGQINGCDRAGVAYRTGPMPEDYVPPPLRPKPAGAAAAPKKPATGGPIRDLFVIIGGWAQEDAVSSDADPSLPPTPAYSASGDLLKRVQGTELTLPSGHTKLAKGLKGRMLDTDVDAAFEFISNNYDPRGKLIVAGHSMGGAAAHRLCRKIDKDGPFWDPYFPGLTTSGVSAVGAPKASGVTILPSPAIGGVSRPNPRVRVDLLVTVDAARGNISDSLDRSVGRCVRTNLNYYQTTKKNIEKSCGGPNSALDPKQTIVWNHDLTGRSLPDPDPAKPAHTPDHYSILAQLNNTIMKIFQQALEVTQVTDFWDP
jgi:hypothetical protein